MSVPTATRNDVHRFAGARRETEVSFAVMKISTEKYRATDISGDYAAMARAFGGYGERVTRPEEIVPAIKRGIEQTRKGNPVLLEFITSKETSISTFK